MIRALQSKWFAPSILAAITLAIHLVVWNRTLVGWDEWILASIMGRLSGWAIPAGEWYDVIVPTGYSYPPIFFWLGGALTYLFGLTPFVLRLTTTISAAAATACITVTGQKVGGAWAGWTAGLMATTMTYLNFQDTISLDFLLSVCIILSVNCLLRALNKEERRMLIAAVFLGGAACFVKYHGVVYHAILCIIVVALPQTRAMIKGRKCIAFAAAALALPTSLLLLEALTWQYYGWEKTHIAEVFRVMTWTSYLNHPLTGEIIIPTWYYYLQFCLMEIGPLACVLAVVSPWVIWRHRHRDAFLLVVVVVLWFYWASSSHLKHDRYVLPAVYLAMPLVGLVLAHLAKGRVGRHYARVLLAVMIIAATWNLVERVNEYIAKTDRHSQVHALVQADVPPDATIMSDAVPFQDTGGTGLSPIKQRVLGPANPDWLARARYVITDENAYQMHLHDVLQGSQSYLDFRERIVTEWDTLLDIGAGRERIRVLRRPEGWVAGGTPGLP
jgi:4-amino-4-deoxy-L-arabinose transferase-like glycosyltransferase